MSSWKERSEMFRTMPPRATLTFLLGVACIFAGFGVLQDVNLLEMGLKSRLVVFVAIYSAISVGWAYFGPRRMIRPLLAVITVQLVGPTLLEKLWPYQKLSLSPAEISLRVIHHNWLTMTFVLSGYLLLIVFFRMEGTRYIAAMTEIRLASEIQQQLVPVIAETHGPWEFFGISIPSGTVGGDLLDVFESNGCFCAYLADVAGHGVRAGVLMSMVKSAARTRLISAGPDQLLPALNAVLAPMTDAATYATFAQVSGDTSPDRGSVVRFTLAAHLPILQYSSGSKQVCRHSVANLPLAMFPDLVFETGSIDCVDGDLLALVTDGLTEIFNKAGVEVGDAYIERILIENADRPLASIADLVMHAAERAGNISDDRTLLLIRRTQGAPAQ